MMQGSLWLAPFLAVVPVRRLDVDPEWKAIAEMALVSYVLVGLVALILQAGA